MRERTEPLVDCHVHFFETPRRGAVSRDERRGEEVDAYATLRDTWKIESAIVVGYEGEPRYAGSNVELLRLSRSHPWMHPLAYAHPWTTSESAASFIREGFAGAAVYLVDEQSAAQTEEMLFRIAPVLAERQALLSVNVIPPLYGVVERLARGFPSLPILISHLGLPGVAATSATEVRSSLGRLGELAAGSTTHIKLSGFYALGDALDRAEAAAILLDSVGPDRLVWGSDYPVVLNREPFSQAVAESFWGSLDSRTYELIAHGNARRLLSAIES